MTHIMKIDEMTQSQNANSQYDIPKLNYDNPNDTDFYKLQDFLESNDLFPKTKIPHKNANFGKWDLMIGYIDDYRKAYILFYWWGDRFDEYDDRYLIFLEDGVSNTSRYNFEKDPKVLAELDKIVEVFGKSKEWKDK